ncbi:MAG: hypothetical protein DRH33_00700 [Candidatus Nealsonbacteria bacterium]|nr:MAG: hypothetical protein DRH33_00700 [Candidatus Nealsonbacteria bacterium]
MGFPAEKAGRNQGVRLTFLSEEKKSEFRSPPPLSALVMSAPVAFSRRTLQPSAEGREGGGALLTKERSLKVNRSFSLSFTVPLKAGLRKEEIKGGTQKFPPISQVQNKQRPGLCQLRGSEFRRIENKKLAE